MSMRAETILFKEYKNSRNFMTPYVMEVGKINKNTAYEISSGKGFTGGKIYGLSIVRWDPEAESTSRDIEGSGCYHDLDELQSVVDKLKRASLL